MRSIPDLEPQDLHLLVDADISGSVFPNNPDQKQRLARLEEEGYVAKGAHKHSDRTQPPALNYPLTDNGKAAARPIK
jgi:hypothetical protein